MCLSTIVKKYSKPQKGIKTGYKVLYVEEEENGYCSAYYNIGKIGIWQQANKGRLYTNSSLYSNTSYTTGFHIFKTREAARKYLKEAPALRAFHCKVFKVEFNDVVAEGTQNGEYCYVAKKIKVLRPIKSKVKV